MRVALAVGCAVLVAAVAAQLAHDSPRLAGSNDVEPSSFVVFSEGAERVCQRGETLFEDTSSVRLTIGTFGRPTPALHARWLEGGQVLARGDLAPGWDEGVVRIPLADVPSQTTGGATLCLRAKSGAGRLAWGGQSEHASFGATVGGQPQHARVSVISDRAGSLSLFDALTLAADRYPAGNADWLGTWTWWAMIALLAGALAAAAAALIRHRDGLSRRVPASGWLCALTAFLVCAVWALLTPPFQVPDEISHTAYVQAIAESGDLPRDDPNEPSYSEQERSLLSGLGFYSVVGRRDARPPWTAPEEARLRAAESAPASRDVSNATTASANPPLFYLLEAPIYWATPSEDLLDKLLPMRLLSALFGAATVLAIFLFLRELLPGSPWLWPAGALVCAFHPGFGFISSGINPDALVFAASATTFWMMARILRRGLTTRRVAALAAAVAAGVLAKPLFLGLVPAAVLAVVIAAARALRANTPATRVAAVGGVGAVAAVTVLAYEIVGRLAFDHPYFAEGRSVGGTVGTSAGSLRDEVSYVWQLFLPRIPGQYDQFPGFLPLRETWLDGFAGQFGWLDYTFSPEVLDWAARVGIALLAAALVSLFVNRRRLRSRWLELAVYVVAAAGIAVAIGTQDYSVTESGGNVRFTQARYLMPLLALYAGVVAVALRLGRGRAGPYLAVAAVTVAAVHAVSGMLLTVGRYYL